MGKGQFFTDWLGADTDIPLESLSGQPIIEICGRRRVLIENHRGIKSYGNDRILVAVNFGCICVSGSCLEILHMTKVKIVIRGEIQSVMLQGRGSSWE